MKKSFSMVLIFSLIACVSTYPKYISMLDQMNDFVWVGTYENEKVTLKIHEQNGIRFNGHLFFGQRDTLYLHGFEKGENHPTMYYHELNDSLPAGSIFIWTQGLTSDTLEIINRSDSLSDIPKQLLLFKQKLKKE